MTIFYKNHDEKPSPNLPTRIPTGATIGYAHPGDPTLQGVVIPHGRVETRQLDAGRDTHLLITTFRCACDFEIVTMEPMDEQEGSDDYGI